MPDQDHHSPAIDRDDRCRPDRAGELALTPRVRLGGELLFVPTASARTLRRRARGAGAAGRPAGVVPSPV